MKKIILVLILIGLLFTSFKLINIHKNTDSSKTSKLNKSNKGKLQMHLKEVQELANANSKYNNEIAFFIDMKIPSGKNRFYIYDLKNNKLIDEGLVAHGSGSETQVAGILKFSNTNNSFCTSLGKYSIENSYVGKFGKAYKLFGLDATNSNAFDRNIVLHTYFDVPYEEQEVPICNSLG